MEEVVAKADVISFHSLQIIYLLRFFAPETRLDLLTNPHSAQMTDFIDKLIGCVSHELLIPKQLSIYDHRIQYEKSAQNYQKEQIEIQRLKDALTYQDTSYLEDMLASGLSPDQIVENGLTPLAWMLIDVRRANYLSSMVTLVQHGASIAHKLNGVSLFTWAVMRSNYYLVSCMLERKNKGDAISINAEYEAILVVLKKHDVAMLDLFENYGLNYNRFNYKLMLDLLDQSDLVLEDFISRLINHGFKFHEFSTVNNHYATFVIKKLLVAQKLSTLQRLINEGILEGANHSAYFTPELYEKLSAHTQLVLPKYFKHHFDSVHNVHIYLVTSDNRYLLIRAHHHQQPVPFWHGITGSIVGLFTLASISQFCLNKISWRPQIESFKVIPASEDMEDEIILVYLKPGIEPQVFSTEYAAEGKCQTPMLWQQDHLRTPTDLSRAILQNEDIVAAQKRLLQLKVSTFEDDDFNFMHLNKKGVYQPEENILIELMESRRPPLKLIEALLNEGYSANLVMNYMNSELSLLMLAALQRNYALLDLLLDKGADPYQRVGVQAQTIAQFAIATNNLMVLKKLQDRGYDLNHAANGDLIAYAKKEGNEKEIIAYLKIHLNRSNDTLLRKIQKTPNPNHLFFHEWSTWLTYSRLTDKTDLDERIAQEYQLTFFIDTHNCILMSFERELKNLKIIPQEIQFALAEGGYEPIIYCLGMSKPVIAISRLLLQYPKFSVDLLMVGIYLAVEMHQFRLQTKTPFKNIPLEAMTQMDIKIINDYGFSFTDIIHYLQMMNWVSQQTKDKPYFIWPYELTTDEKILSNHYDALDRIKLLYIAAHKDQFKKKNEAGAASSIFF